MSRPKSTAPTTQAVSFFSPNMQDSVVIGGPNMKEGLKAEGTIEDSKTQLKDRISPVGRPIGFIDF